MTLLKTKQLLYFAITLITSATLTMVGLPGVGILLFTAIQFGMILYIIKTEAHNAEHGRKINLRALWIFVPIGILSLNAVISANDMWGFTNFVVTVLLYCLLTVMLLGEVGIAKAGESFIRKILGMAVRPFCYFGLPFGMIIRAGKGKLGIAAKVIFGLILAAPFMIFLLIMLSSADVMFRESVNSVIEWASHILSFGWFIKLIGGAVVASYLFGLLHIAFAGAEPKNRTPHMQNYANLYKQPREKTDMSVVMSVFVLCIAAIYAMFAFIQFRYLFSGASALPGGMSYTEYARSGFFELCVLSALNVVLILFYVSCTRGKMGKKAILAKSLNIFLCALTFVLLISSFYRMTLYSGSDGLTRLRFHVFGFLIFEAVGLLITVYYILKPKFNMVATYAAIALCYYLLLNVVSTDYFVAKSQVERCLAGDAAGMQYTLTLSADAAPQVERLLYAENVSESVKEACREYLGIAERDGHIVVMYAYGESPDWRSNTTDWRSYNIMRSRYPDVYPMYYEILE